MQDCYGWSYDLSQCSQSIHCQWTRGLCKQMTIIYTHSWSLRRHRKRMVISLSLHNARWYRERASAAILSPLVYCRNLVEVLAGFRLVMSELRNCLNPLGSFGRQNDYNELSHNWNHFCIDHSDQRLRNVLFVLIATYTGSNTNGRLRAAMKIYWPAFSYPRLTLSRPWPSTSTIF